MGLECAGEKNKRNPSMNHTINMGVAIEYVYTLVNIIIKYEYI